ncbi:hypothetical protein [Acetobacter tropicalis]|jgi:hypothetical protein|uniref:Uncharacterized protein n=1 Tax=Acetobacter tropicalis TaxID=104102 RepID=A0A094YXG5_9PROT|nr:hypothetical protein [Acetobacter tropicalis]KGB25369.1 hypothetical protein AtDm6_0564 [Acetobacter tropicalis]MDO8172598.1 hypothetical protein [Acetobacter tropicalis]
MAPPPKKDLSDVPVITLKGLILIHVGLALFLLFWGWLDWSLPQ